MGSNGLPSSVSDLFVGDVVPVSDAEEFSEASHLHGLLLVFVLIKIKFIIQFVTYASRTKLIF